MPHPRLEATKRVILKACKSSVIVVMVITILSLWSVGSYFAIDAAMKEYNDDQNISKCNVYGLKIHGELVAYHAPNSYNSEGKLIDDSTSIDDVHQAIDQAESNDNIKYILADISSPGGTPVAGFSIMSALKNSKKPVIAYTGNGATSSAYLAATGAQTLFATAVSEVAGIGVTYSYEDDTVKYQQDGLKYIDLSMGKYKDMFHQGRPLSDEEKQLVMRDVKIVYEKFVKAVSDNRKLDIEKVRKLADGSTMLGDQALKDGLIDKVGDSADARAFLKEKLGEDVNVCWGN